MKIKYWPVIFLGVMLVLLELSCYSFTAANDQVVQWDNNLQYPALHSGVDMSALNHYNIDNNGTVFIKDGHFWSKQGRINFFGVNLTFSTCFPEKEQAEQLASQLAGLGVNIVRLHHMDNRDIWGDNIATYADFDAGKMEKLDYLVFCLKNKGIYVDLNLHVSWQYISDKNSPLYNLIYNEKAFKYGKGLDIFLPELIAKQKEYAARLLNHRNPYTGLVYKDDPVVAMVEINNEDSFYRNMLSEKGIDLLPPVYRDVLNEKFRNFLQAKYGSLADLKTAWQDKNAKLTAINILPFDQNDGWRVQISDPSRGTIHLGGQETAVHLHSVSKNGFFQFFNSNLVFKQGQDYTVVVEVTGQKDAQFTLNVMRQCAPYDNIGLLKTVTLAKGGRNSITVAFTATQDVNGLGRITLGNFNGGHDFVVHSIKLYQGKAMADPWKGITNINGITLPGLDELPTYPAQGRDDVTAFFRQTEWQYWSDMIRYVKEDLGVRAPITGTQIDYSTPELAQLYDYVDIHSYWQHPVFPGKAWDSNDYYLKNVSMVSEAGSNFDKVASFRVQGKPFTISEYNHPYPNMYNTEAPLLLSVLSKLQDYDAVFLFDYGNISNFKLPSYFSQDTKFANKSLYPVSSLIFRDPTIKPLPEEVVWPVGKGDLFRAMREGRPYVNPYCGEWEKQHPPGLFTLYQTQRVSLQLTEQGNYDYSKICFTDEATVSPNFTWKRGTPNYRDAFFKYDEAKAKVYIGWNTQEQYDFNNVSLRIGNAPKQYFQFTIMNKDGEIGSTGQYMVTLAGREFYDHVDYIDHATKAKLNPFDDNYRTKIMAVPNAAQAAELIENFTAELSIRLDKPYHSITVYTIDSVGNRNQDIPFQVVNNKLKITLKQEDKSIVYCIEVGNR